MQIGLVGGTILNKHGLTELPMGRNSMKIITRWVLHLLLVASCVACMPFPRQLYIPEGAGGRLIYTPCLPNDVPDSIEFDIGGITLDVRDGILTNGRHFIEVRFEVPKDKVVKLQDDKVTFSWGDKRPSSEGMFQKISRAGGHIFSFENPNLQQHMLAIREPMVGDVDRNFWVATYITPQPEGDFSVTLPSITVNGTKVELPEIRFRKGPFPIIAPINC